MQIVDIKPQIDQLVAAVTSRSMEGFGIESWSPEKIAAKKRSAKAAFAAWIAQHQLTLNMPSSVKKAVENANEALSLTVGKGIELA